MGSMGLKFLFWSEFGIEVESRVSPWQEQEIRESPRSEFGGIDRSKIDRLDRTPSSEKSWNLSIFGLRCTYWRFVVCF